MLVLFSLSGYNAGFPSLRFPELIKDSYWLTTARICYSASILRLRFLPRVLPQPSEWAFHLDLWQSPYAVARYYQVPLWSQEHLDAMRPLMKMLANAGQKIITATLTHKPWNGQTEDYFDTMVTWIKRADGTWTFDYTIFDRWVEFMMSVGIDKQINCYSMVPWKLSFQYYDQATNSLKFVKTAPGEQAYEEMWVAMLASFSKTSQRKKAGLIFVRLLWMSAQWM